MKSLQTFISKNSSKMKFLHTLYAGISKSVYSWYNFFFCIPTNEAVGKKQCLKETSEMA